MRDPDVNITFLVSNLKTWLLILKKMRSLYLFGEPFHKYCMVIDLF